MEKNTHGQPRILLTGATGYIGGSVLARLLQSQSANLTESPITCLVRGVNRAPNLTAAYGPRVNPVVYADLDDLESTTAAAAQCDVVINTALGYHVPSGLVLVRGLAQRKASTGCDVWMIHTSGTSNLADLPVTRKRIEDKSFNDQNDDVQGYERILETQEPYAQRTAELGVVNAAMKTGVRVLVLMSPTIYGQGTGLFNTASIQIPAYINIILDQGRGVVLGEGQGVWDHVHIADLAELYHIVVKNILEQGGRSLVLGGQPVLFAENGRHTWLEIAQGLTDACYVKGLIADRHVDKIGIHEGVHILGPRIGGGAEQRTVELALASNARTRATLARSLGWKPLKGDTAWRQTFEDDLKIVIEQRKGGTGRVKQN